MMPDFERMTKEVVVVYFQALRKPSVKVGGLKVGI
jgi:hypothetical protein